MKITLKSVTYNILLNAPVSFFLCLSSSFLSKTYNVKLFFINFIIAFTISMLIGLFIPLLKIGKWFTRLFGVDDTTYTGNIKYRLLATLSSSFIFFIILNPLLCFINVVIFADLSFTEFLRTWTANIIPMFIVGFFSSLISDIPAFRISNKIKEK